MTISSRLFLILVVSLSLSTGLCGCRTDAPPKALSLATARRTAASPSGSLVAVYSHPLYRQAEAACRKQQFQQAAGLLQSLSQASGLSAEQVAYCQQQRQICLDHLKPKSADLAAEQARNPMPRTAEDADCGPRALLRVCEQLEVKTSLEKLRQAAGTTERGTSLEGLAKAAKAVGLKAEGVQVNREGWNEVQMPALAWVNRDHFVAVLEMQGEGEQATARIHDPNEVKAKTMPREQLLRLCGGYLLLLSHPYCKD